VVGREVEQSRGTGLFYSLERPCKPVVGCAGQGHPQLSPPTGEDTPPLFPVKEVGAGGTSWVLPPKRGSSTSLSQRGAVMVGRSIPLPRPGLWR